MWSLASVHKKKMRHVDRNYILQIHVENVQEGLDEMKMVLRNL